MSFTISNTLANNMAMKPSTQQPLTTESKSLISETLAQFDADSLSEQDATSIVQAFSQAGISPGKELATIMSQSGFDAHAVGELANIENEGKAGAKPPPPRLDMNEMVDYLETLLADKSSTTFTDEEKQAVYQELINEFQLPQGESLINIKV